MFDLQAIPFEYMFGGLVLLVVLVVATMTKLKYGLVIIVVMFFVASTAKQNDESSVRLWLYPLQANRSPIYLAFGVTLLVALFAHVRDLKSGFPTQALILLFISLYAGTLRIFHEGPASGLMSLGFACATVIPIVLLVGAIVKNWDDCYVLVRGLALANVVWIGAVAIQIVHNAPALYGGGNARFFGLTGNPQHAGTALAIMGTIALWLLLNDPHRKFRLAWVALLSIDVILLVWTGSRTGAGAFVVGAGLATYARLGRTVLYLPFIALAVVGAFSFFSDSFSLEAAERLTSTENTRAAVWARMIAVGTANPLFGVGIAETDASESSYLYGFAAYGLGMVALLAVLVIVSAMVCTRLFFLRWQLDKSQRAFADLIIGYNALYFAGSVLEGYIMARVANTLVMMLVFSTMAGRIFAMHREGVVAYADETEDECEYDDELEHEWHAEYGDGDADPDEHREEETEYAY